MGEENGYNTLAILALVFTFLFFPVGFILGIISLSQIKKTHEKGEWMAIVSIVIGSIFFLFFILMILIGIAWIGIRNTVNEGDLYSSLSYKCANTEVRVIGIVNIMPEVYDVTLSRGFNDGNEIIGGVSLVFTNRDNVGVHIYDVPGDIFEETIRVSIPEEKLENPNKVDVIVYFLDDYGNKQFCDNSNSFEVY